MLIARIDQPQTPPTEISTTPNRFREIPQGTFEVNPSDPERDGSGPAGRGSNGPGSGLSVEVRSPETEVVKADPPPIPKNVEPKKPVVQTKGVVNGFAISLPKPNYPATAKNMGITGDVHVQVLISEQGDVVSAKAATGHMFLKPEAERAAWKAKFKPTLLSDVPVKVTGVIIYRFNN